jgi:serine/threonine protein kinase
MLLLGPFLIVLACFADRGTAKLAPQQYACNLDYTKIPYVTLPGPLSSTYCEVLGPIGSGASSSVQLIRRFRDNATLAIKQFAPIPPDASEETKTTLWQYIALEYYIGTLLNEVKGFARTEELLYSEHDSTWSIVQSYCPRSLAKEMELNVLTETDLVDIGRQIAVALQEMHTLGLAYGDLKLENTLLDATGTVVQLVDFGSSTFADCKTQTPGWEKDSNVRPRHFGTPPYLPPEMFSALEYDRQKSDIWSLGILLHLMFVASLPWRAASLDDDPCYLSFAAAGVPEFDNDAATRRCQLRIRGVGGVGDSIKFGQCSSGRFKLLQKLPRAVRPFVSDLLETEPEERRDLRSMLDDWEISSISD